VEKRQAGEAGFGAPEAGAMSEREEVRLVVRYLEREIAQGRTSLWEAAISASRRNGVKDAPAPAPPLAAIDLEAESLLHDGPQARPGPGDPLPGDDLLKVATEVRACTKCGLSGCRTQAVPGVGAGVSGIVFVGEAPGAEEDRRGEPFVGRAGELLTKILAAMDERKLIPGVQVSRNSVYICNVLKCRPPENRNPLPHEIEACSPYLLRQLAILRPKIICCLGKFAAELLVGAKGTVASMRGKVYRFGSAKLLVTYHPAACLRNPSLKRPVWEDMQRLAEEYASP
jgi:uracil-DNA glycosylase